MSGDRAPQKELLHYLGRGPREVDVIHEHLLNDTRRNKDIPLRIYAPASGGPHPVILYSHGAGDSNATSPLLLRHWASHGYVVIAPMHLFGERPFLERSVMRLREELVRMFQMGPEAWRERTDDLVAVMDNLGGMAGGVPALNGKVDEDRIAVAGHSNGGYTAMLLGGATMTDASDGESRGFADPRPRAAMIVSGPGCDHNLGLTKDSWNKFTRPLMVMAGSRDPGYAPGFGTQWRTDPYRYSPPGDKYLLYLRGAHHLSYIGPIFDIPLRDPAHRGKIANGIRSAARAVARVAPVIDQVGLFDYVRIASVAFWNAYLKDDGRAREFLRSRALDTYSANNARLTSR